MGQKKNMCDFPHILAKTMRHVAFRHLMSLKHGSDSPETSHDPAYECTTVEGREPLLEPCSQANESLLLMLRADCSLFALKPAHSSRLLPQLPHRSPLICSRSSPLMEG